MKLEYQNCLIEDVKFSDTTKVENKTLFINKDEMIDFLKDVDFVTEISIDLAKPGEKLGLFQLKIVLNLDLELVERISSQVSQVKSNNLETESLKL